MIDDTDHCDVAYAETVRSGLGDWFVVAICIGALVGMLCGWIS